MVVPPAPDQYLTEWLRSTLQQHPDWAQVADTEFYEATPHNLVAGDGAEFAVTAVAFYNSGGGLFVLGASDPDWKERRFNDPINIDVMNYVTRTWVERELPISTRFCPHPEDAAARVELAVVLPRREAGLLRLRHGLGRFGAGTVPVRHLGRTVAGRASHFSLFSGAPCQQAAARLPDLPPSPWHFVGRSHELVALLQWFSQTSRCRQLFLVGPGGVGRSALAIEFGRRIASAGLAKVLFIDKYSRGSDRSCQVLFAAGLVKPSDPVNEEEWVSSRLKSYFNSVRSLIILDDVDQAPDENLSRQIISSMGDVCILHSATGGDLPYLNSMELLGFTEDEEYAEFFNCWAPILEVPAPIPADYEAIARVCNGLPALLRQILELRRTFECYDDAVRFMGKRKAPD